MAMAIVTGRDMAGLDSITIRERGIPGPTLMENAGSSVAAWVSSRSPEPWLQDVLIVAGTGNNGGDGFVIARLLIEEGLDVRTLIVGDAERIQGDAAANLQRLRSRGGAIETATDASGMSRTGSLGSPTLIVDALLGTGISGVPRPLQAAAIDAMAGLYERSAVIAVDIPSGVVADDASVPGSAVHADHTFTFGLPKRGHFLPSGSDYIGDLHICDIGFPGDILASAGAEALLVTGTDVRGAIPRWKSSTHKGDRGRLLIVAGSCGMSGAAILAARAAVMGGAGLVTLALPASQQPIAASSIWEALTLPLPETPEGSLAPEALHVLKETMGSMSAVVAGPGLSRNTGVGEVLEGLLSAPVPLLLDADALWALSPKQLASRTAPTLLTPHPGELAHFMGCGGPADVQADRWGWAARAASESQATVLLKGAGTVIACPDETLLVNPTGNAALATGGTGDVLSGLAGALLAQGLVPRCVAACAAYLHGAAADRLRDDGRATLLAGELIEPLGAVLGAMGLARPSQLERMPGDVPVFDNYKPHKEK